MKLSKIIKAINNLIRQGISESDLFKDYFNGNPIKASDVSEPLERPSIKINIEDCDTEKIGLCRARNPTVRIYFFAKDREKYRIDNINMQELIEETLLDGLYVTEDFYIYIDEITSTVTDTVLVCSFNLETLEEIDYDLNLEPLQELNLTLNNCDLTEKEESEE